MATLVEEQIHAALVAGEEARCKEMEASTGKPVNRRELPKPWKRVGPALLQNPELLQHVTELDYQIEAPFFEEYLRRRGLLHVVPEEGSWRHRFLAKHSLTRGDFVKQCVAEGEPAYATPQDIETGWRIIRLGRAALQDGWEAFLAERVEVERRETAAPVEAPPKPKRPSPTRKAPAKSKAPSKGKRKTPATKAPAKGRNQLDLFAGAGRRRR